MNFKIPRKGYSDRQLYKKSTIEINPGITVLIGCNGSGKTTMLNEIEGQLKEQNIPVFKYNNLSDGGSNSMSSLLYSNDFDAMAALFSASEGESIAINLGLKAKEIIHLVKTGRKKRSKFEEALRDIQDIKDEEVSTNQRWILFDAIDSGLSIDQVNDLKDYFFKAILDNSTDLEIYIVVSANEYELCDGLPCFSVIDSQYISINSYEDYKKHILKSRDYKDKQISKITKKE